MSDNQLVVLSLAGEDSARDLVRQLEAIDKLDANVTIIDAAIAVKTRRGKPKLKQLKVSGSSTGGVLGAIGGAFAGLTSIFRNAGIDEDMMRRTAEQLEAGEVALFILYSGHWDRSSAVLRDALAAHGIRYGENRDLQSYSTPSRHSTTSVHREVKQHGQETPVTKAESPIPVSDDNVPKDAEPVVYDEPIFGDEMPSGDQIVVGNEQASVEDPAFDYEPGFDEETATTAADYGDPTPAVVEDPVTAASRAAITGEQVDEFAFEVDAEADMETLSEVATATGNADTSQAEELLGVPAPVGEAELRLALMAHERRYDGLELGRIAGELAQIGREIAGREMPILSALLIHRSGILQQIAAHSIAAAASANELAELLDATGGQFQDLGATKMDQAALHLAAASALAIRAADAGASQTGLVDNTK